MIDSSIRVLVADGNELFRLGLSCLLEREPDIEVVGVASNVNETLLKIAQYQPDVVLIESCIREGKGLGAVVGALSRSAGRRVAVVAVSATESGLRLALQLGVQGYILKDSSLDEVLQAVHSVVGGALYHSRSIYRRVRDLAPTIGRAANGHNATKHMGIYALSERERSVLRLVAVGSTNQEIGDALGIATNTVKVHLRAILDKLNVRNRQQAAAYAIQEGLVGRLFPRNDEPVPEFAGAGAHSAHGGYYSH